MPLSDSDFGFYMSKICFPILRLRIKYPNFSSTEQSAESEPACLRSVRQASASRHEPNLCSLGIYLFIGYRSASKCNGFFLGFILSSESQSDNFWQDPACRKRHQKK